ncbi:SRPBCC domain-containing protein [Arenimonas fontis]|nr:SRPBCC domain-containing protein [Arenimonas fontis]
MRIFRRGFPALVLLTGFAAPAAAELKDSSASGFTIENVVEVPVTPAEAWRGLVREVDRWWPRDHTWWGEESTLSIDPVAGGCFCERAGARQAEHLRVGFVDPEKTLRLLGGLGPLQGLGLHGVLEFSIAAREEGGSRIVMRYRAGGYATEDLQALAPIVDRVQAQQLRALATHLGAAAPAE